jgi:CRISPR system Cascade subunit CasA
MYCCCGFKYNTFKDGFPAEPTAVVQVVTKRDAKGNEVAERKLLKVQPAKSIWRELAALIVKRTAFGVGGPLAIENVPYDSEFDFHVCAMTRDQASMDIAIESVFHITPRFQTNIAVYQSEVKWSEWLSSKLGWAIETYRKEIDGDWQSRLERSKEKWALKERLYSTATTYYWTTVEKNLSLLMSHIEAIGTDAVDSTREVWRAMLFRSASEAYSVACGQETSRQRRAFAKGWQRLFASKGEPETDSTEIKEDDE